jgi:hypothetical protein
MKALRFSKNKDSKTWANRYKDSNISSEGTGSLLGLGELLSIAMMKSVF